MEEAGGETPPEPTSAGATKLGATDPFVRAI
jgi:hypothetical protein